MADLAAARREAEEALAAWDCDASRISPSPRHSLAVDCVMALRSLLAATQPAAEPVSNAYTLPQEVREAAFGACGNSRCRAVSRLVCDQLCRSCEDALLAARGGRS